MEYAEVTVDLAHGRIGDLIITLISPDGTESILMNRPGKVPGSDSTNLGIDNIDSLKFTLTSTNFYGEHGDGQWQLRVTDAVTGEIGTLNSWKLDLHGSSSNGNETYIFTDEIGANDQGNHTILDTSGINSINAASLVSDSVINLNAGEISTINGQQVLLATNTLTSEYYQKQTALPTKQAQLIQEQQQLTTAQTDLANANTLLPQLVTNLNNVANQQPASLGAANAALARHCC